MEDLQNIFEQLKKLLKKYDKAPLVGREELLNSTVKEKRPTFVLYGRKDVKIGNKKPQPMYFMGVILQKNFVGFYSLPLYTHAKVLTIENVNLKKTLKGKSCFHITRLDKELLKELENHLKQALLCYKKEGWV